MMVLSRLLPSRHVSMYFTQISFMALINRSLGTKADIVFRLLDMRKEEGFQLES